MVGKIHSVALALAIALCGTFSTPSCSWSPTNTGENDALQLIIQATQLGSEPTPPPPPPIINTGAGVRGP